MSYLNTTELQVNAEHPKEEIKTVVIEYNQHYKQCFFAFNEQNCKLEIISTSSPNFDHSQRLLIDLFS